MKIQHSRIALPVLSFLLLFSIGVANSQRLKPIPHPIGQPRAAASPAAKTGNPATSAVVSRWTPLAIQPSFLINGASNPILLTDGSVLVQDQGFPDWWKLTPDASGSYVNGTWTQIASLPSTYSPLYHSSAVLPDGRLVIEGGEYLLNAAQTELVPTWTAEGSIYDPLANTWTPVAPPSGWTTIGDAQSVVLPNGVYMQANCCTTDAALLDSKSLTWSPTGANKFDINDEEGWVLLPNEQVLTVDAYVYPYVETGTNSEIYSPLSGTWRSAGSTIVQIFDSGAACGGYDISSSEVGPGVLRPNGTVFFAGANTCGAGNTAIYDSYRGTWKAGPTFPGTYDVADGPAALEPNGKVLIMASEGIFNYPSQFFEWDGEELTPIAGTPNTPYDSSYYGNMLVLPTGQILLTDFSNDIEIFSPSPVEERPDWAPQIVVAPAQVKRGSRYTISGTHFNGVSQGAFYGDDVQAATNFPLVRITNLGTGHVFYSRTHDHSFMGVASPAAVSTHFDVPVGQEAGLSKIEVVANGVASQPVLVLVK